MIDSRLLSKMSQTIPSGPLRVPRCSGFMWVLCFASKLGLTGAFTLIRKVQKQIWLGSWSSRNLGHTYIDEIVHRGFLQRPVRRPFSCKGPQEKNAPVLCKNWLRAADKIMVERILPCSHFSPNEQHAIFSHALQLPYLCSSVTISPSTTGNNILPCDC